MIEGWPSERLGEGAAERETKERGAAKRAAVDWERDVPPCPAPPHILAGGRDISYEGG
jgi:hypothetical protein